MKELSALTTADRLLQPKLSRPQEGPEAPLLFCAMWAALGQIHRHMNPVKAPTSH